MKAKEIFALALEQYYGGNDVAIVTGYEKARKILKKILSLPDTVINGIELNSFEWDGYDGAWLIDITADKEVYCQKAININGDGMPFRGDGYYIIDKSAMGEFKPEDFVFSPVNSTIKVV